MSKLNNDVKRRHLNTHPRQLTELTHGVDDDLDLASIHTALEPVDPDRVQDWIDIGWMNDSLFSMKI